MDDFLNTVDYIKINLSNKKFDSLKKEDEYKLIQEAQSGSLSAKNKLIEANLRFVFNLAFQYSKKSSATIEDLFQEGVSGLNFSIFKFDFERKKNIKFYSYAQYFIRNSFVSFIRNHTHNVKVAQINRKENLYDFIETCIEDFNVDNYNQEHFKLTPESLKSFQPFSEDKDHLEYCLKKLTEQDRYIICSYFGINNIEKKNYNMLSEELNVSNKTMKTMVDKILLKLREIIGTR